MIRYYVVTAPGYEDENVFIAKANNKREAIDIVFAQYFKWQNDEFGWDYRKIDFVAEELEKIFKKSDNKDCIDISA